jgi:uncharacterized OsmC-like protein
MFYKDVSCWAIIISFHIIITVYLHESNKTKLNQLMHKLSHLYCSLSIILYSVSI